MTTVDQSDANPADAASAALTRSEEQLTVSLPVRVRGGLRISKTVITETVTQTVQIRREQLVVEDLSIDNLTLGSSLQAVAEHGAASHEFIERDFDIVLHEERVVLSTEVVPVERVRISTRVVTDQIDVTDTVRREQIEITTDIGPDAQRADHATVPHDDSAVAR